MGLILDFSILIAAERKGHSVPQLFGHVLSVAGNRSGDADASGAIEPGCAVFAFLRTDAK